MRAEDRWRGDLKRRERRQTDGESRTAPESSSVPSTETSHTKPAEERELKVCVGEELAHKHCAAV